MNESFNNNQDDVLTEDNLKTQSEDKKISKLTIFFLAVLLFNLFVANVGRVDGASMAPTLKHGISGINIKITKYFKQFKRGDILFFHPPGGGIFIKRVIAVGGDHIISIDGVVYVNGEEIVEDYVLSQNNQDKIDFQHDIPEGHYWMMGDNRDGSFDSRDFGPISHDKIIGELWRP